jgi:hypothetical protein
MVEPQVNEIANALYEFVKEKKRELQASNTGVKIYMKDIHVEAGNQIRLSFKKEFNDFNEMLEYIKSHRITDYSMKSNRLDFNIYYDGGERTKYIV